MRITVILDDDVAAKLRSKARKHGKPFKQALNNALRRGLDIAGVLDRIEGEHRR